MKKYKVGIIGATGTVGQKFIILLENHPWFDVTALAASAASSGKTFEEAVENKWVMERPMPEKIKNIIILDAEHDARKIAQSVDFVFCAVSMNKEDTKQLEEKYAKLECPVISNNSANRKTPDVPMIIPEINADHMNIIPFQKQRLGTKRGFITVKSNCSIQCFVPAIHPLLDLDVKNILVCTYQAISGAGKTFESWPEMIDNIIPLISGEEEKSEEEPLKIWGTMKNGEIIPSKSINITSQCLRIPVTDGHTAAVFASFDKKTSIGSIIKRLEQFESHPKSIDLPSSPKKFIHYFPENNRPQIKSERNLENGMSVSVGRVREDSQYDIKFISMSHNTIRGAAGGAILLAEMLCRENYI